MSLAERAAIWRKLKEAWDGPDPDTDPDVQQLFEWDKLTDSQKCFLIAYMMRGSVTAACSMVRVGIASPYRWREKSTAFADAYKTVFDITTDSLEGEAVTRAMAKSDYLLKFLLEVRRYMTPADFAATAFSKKIVLERACPTCEERKRNEGAEAPAPKSTG